MLRPELQAARELYGSVSQALRERESEGSQREFAEHLPAELLEAGIKSGRYVQVRGSTSSEAEDTGGSILIKTQPFCLCQGTLNINKHHNEGVVTTEGLSDKDSGAEPLQSFRSDRERIVSPSSRLLSPPQISAVACWCAAGRTGTGPRTATWWWWSCCRGAIGGGRSRPWLKVRGRRARASPWPQVGPPPPALSQRCVDIIDVSLLPM